MVAGIILGPGGKFPFVDAAPGTPALECHSGSACGAHAGVFFQAAASFAGPVVITIGVAAGLFDEIGLVWIDIHVTGSGIIFP